MNPRIIPVCYHPLGSLYWDLDEQRYKLLSNDKAQPEILSQEQADELLVNWLMNHEGVIWDRKLFPPRAIAFLVAYELERCS